MTEELLEEFLEELPLRLEKTEIGRMLKKYPGLKRDQAVNTYCLLKPFEAEPIKSKSLNWKSNIICKDRNLYTGQVNSKKQRNGLGHQIFLDGSIFEGFFENDEIKGSGRLIKSNGMALLGEFRGALLKEKGTILSSDLKSIYKGEIHNNLPHGYGEEKNSDGRVFMGYFERGLKNGEGELVYPDGEVYRGGFKSDKIDGFGVYVYSQNKRYEGEYRQGEMHGKGKFESPEGVYEGEYRKGKKSGKGTMKWSDGRLYKGFWDSDKYDGFGIEKRPDGNRKSGVWVLGELAQPDDNHQNSVTRDDSLNGSLVKVLPKTLKKDAMKFMIQKAKPKNGEFLGSLELNYKEKKLYSRSLEMRLEIGEFNYGTQESIYNYKPTQIQDWGVLNDGSYYKGEVDYKGRPSGKGIKLHEGTIHEGFWVRNKANGLGREINSKKEVYEGFWIKGRKTGFGVKKTKHYTYFGEWSQGKFEGYGVMEKGDGRFEGYWLRGKQHGKGLLDFQDGSFYVGDFANGRIEGHGIIFNAKGKGVRGLWSNGELQTATKKEQLTTEGLSFIELTQKFFAEKSLDN